MILLVLLLLWGWTGFPLELELELGWAGRPVLGAVNPLWVTLRNPGPTAVQGELRLALEFGSPWRGRGTYTALVPCAVGPGGRTRLLLPWPVPAGSFLLRAALRAGERELAEGELAFGAEPEPLRAGIGPPLEPLDLHLAPTELPADPLLLSPFAELRVFTPLGGREGDVVGAWRAFFGGGVRVEAEALRAHLAGLRPPAPAWALLLPGLFLYLLGAAWALPRLAQGRPVLPLALALGFLVLAGFYSVFREAAPHRGTIQIVVEQPSLTSFGLELLGVAPWRREELVLEGWWYELLPPRGWEGRDLLWRFTEAGWQTVLKLEPAVPRLLLRLRREASPPGAAVARPGWLAHALVLPWERARVFQAQPEPGWTAYVVRLP